MTRMDTKNASPPGPKIIRRLYLWIMESEYCNNNGLRRLGGFHPLRGGNVMWKIFVKNKKMNDSSMKERCAVF